jgi:hypothetical protein
MFFAALTSRSCRVPQDGHGHVRVPRPSSARTCPHAEHVLADGYHRSITITRRPHRAALYASMARVYSAHCRPFRDLNRGYRARFAKNAVYATCWWRITCCSGTEDTSLSQARVRFQATRTQPNVRFSTLACSWSGYARHLYAALTTGNLIRPYPGSVNVTRREGERRLFPSLKIGVSTPQKDDPVRAAGAVDGRRRSAPRL